MKQHLNTLFVTTQGAYLRKHGDAIVVRVEKKDRFRVPMINVGEIVTFGRVGLSPYLMGACAAKGISISMMTEQGRFLAAINGFTPGNVLLRREQYRRADDATASAEIARACVIGKLANMRIALRREARRCSVPQGAERLTDAARRIGQTLRRLAEAASVDAVRGIEGDASSVYFGVFNHMIRDDSGAFRFTTRSRRPPRDRINAMLSFLYALLCNDIRSACESAGLDAAVGFLHRDRPGRPGLALDVMEEMRPVIADRVALTLVNRRQVKPEGFVIQQAGGVLMDDETRRMVITEYQARKKKVVNHPFLNEKMTLGMVMQIQARLLARHLRGDLDAYPPFAWR